MTALRTNDLLDDVFSPREPDPMHYNGHPRPEIDAALKTTTSGLAGLLAQLSSVPATQIDREIAELEARLRLLRALRGTPPTEDAPKAVRTAPAAGQRPKPLHALIRTLARHGPLRTKALADASDVPAKAFNRFVDKRLLKKPAGADVRTAPWFLTAAGEKLAREKLGVTVIASQDVKVGDQ